MSKQGRTTHRNESRQFVAEKAANWFVQLREDIPSRKTKTAFTTWLTESPVHVEEYLAIARLWGELADVDKNGDIDIEMLVDEQVVMLRDGGAIESHPASTDRTRVAIGRGRRVARFAVAASVLVAVIATSVFLTLPDNDNTGSQYETALGEQRSVLLDDGSMLSLNTLTRVEVEFDTVSRRVRLLHGEALFEVEKDASRPFFVETGTALVRVTGTKFNVYATSDDTSVTVLEGRVTVMPYAGGEESEPAGTYSALTATARGSVANLGIGEQAVVRSGSTNIELHSVVDVEPLVAWTERRLVFASTPLSAIVAEFNRYNREKIVIDDARMGDLQLSGVFDSNDPESLALFLERAASVDVLRRADGSMVIVRVE